jgi:hypothetical protein
MTRLRIELTKLAAGDAFLKCTRADGSISAQRNDQRRGVFFALHDLRHYAVESVLQSGHGFYGLISAGWEIADTTGKTNRGKLPEETLAIEHLVGMLDADETNSNRANAHDFNHYAAEFASVNRLRFRQAITQDQLTKIRTLTVKLHRQWLDLEPGETMSLWFPLEA